MLTTAPSTSPAVALVFEDLIREPCRSNPWSVGGPYPSQADWQWAWSLYRDETVRSRLCAAWFWQVQTQHGITLPDTDGLWRQLIDNRAWLSKIMPYAGHALRNVPTELSALRPLWDCYSRFCETPRQAGVQRTACPEELTGWLWFGSEAQQHEALHILPRAVQRIVPACDQASLLAWELPRLAWETAKASPDRDCDMANALSAVMFLAYWLQDPAEQIAVPELDHWYQFALNVNAGMGASEAMTRRLRREAGPTVQWLRDGASPVTFRALCRFIQDTEYAATDFFTSNAWTTALVTCARDQGWVPTGTTCFHTLLAALFPPFAEHIQRGAALGLSLDELVDTLPPETTTRPPVCLPGDIVGNLII